MIRPLSVLITCLLIICPAAMGHGSVVAHGGGADWEQESHREMVRWMIEQARPEGAGDAAPVKVVILGAVPREPGDPDAAADAFRREGAEATALVIVEDNADDPEIAAAIEAAQIVWIRGGDQGRYVTWWKSKATERAIRAVFEKGGVVGGTSAGCAVLGEVTYDARNNSLRPEQALSDPYHENLTLTDGFLNMVPGVLFDSHFTERGRIGRLPVMMARAALDFDKDVLGIGVDHGTAVMIDPQGTATVIGRGTVAFLQPPPRSGIGLEPGTTPDIWDIAYDRLATGGVYKLGPRDAVASPGATPHIVAADHGRGLGRTIISGAWARDGSVEERAEQAHAAIIAADPATAVLLGDGMHLVREDDNATYLRHIDGSTSPPMSAVVIRLTGSAKDEEGVPHNRATTAGGAVLCRAKLRITANGAAVWRDYDDGRAKPPLPSSP